MLALGAKLNQIQAMQSWNASYQDRSEGIEATRKQEFSLLVQTH
jgi:hypothetical protein